MNRKQSGFTLLELLLVVGLIVLIMVSGYMVYFSISQTNQIYKESKNLTLLCNGLKQLYARVYTTVGVSNMVVINSKIIQDSNSDKTSGIINNEFGGTILIASSSLGSGSNNSFMIKTNFIPQSACTKWINSIEGNFQKIIVSGVIVKDFNMPVDINQLSVSCLSQQFLSVDLYFLK